MSILDTIVESVLATEARKRRELPIERLLERVRECSLPRRSLRTAMGEGYSDEIRIIAEVKRASPSRGDIRTDLDAAALAREYERGGAAAVSVLTEPRFFKGGAEDLIAARAAVGLPVLRKDFIVTEYAVAESAAMGADAILLIMRILDTDRLAGLYDYAASLGMECLVEVSDERDIENLPVLRDPLLGINNRDLATFHTDNSTAGRLAASLPAGSTPVALSGIGGGADIAAARGAGLRRFLVGEALVRSEAPAALLREWRFAQV